MKPHRISLATAALLLVFSASACAGAGSESGTDKTSDRNQSEHLSTVGAKDFDPTNFDDSARVDNKWMPLEAGAHAVFEGSAIEDGERITRRVVSNVTDLTKEINGVNSVVISASLHRTKMETSGTWVSTPRSTRTVSSIRLRVGLPASKVPRRASP